MATPPSLSVVVTAWSRRRFLLGAVRSAAAQTLPRSSYEIVVVRNFDDPEIDAALDALGVRRILDTDPNVGASVARGLAEATGEVVCFLDDDDEFEPGKLEAIQRLFTADPTLSLVRHRYTCIDSRGEPIPGWPVCAWPANPVDGIVIRRTSREKGRGRILPMYNLSTISVRRAPLLPLAPQFRKVAAASDALVFLSALSVPGTVRTDPRPFTRHRVHRSASREVYTADGLAPPSDNESLMRSLDATERLCRMFRGSPAERAARWIYLLTRFEACLGRGELPPPTPGEYLEFLLGLLRERQAFQIAPFLFAIPRRIAPEFAIRQWWRYRNRKHREELRTLDPARLFPAPEGPP